MQVNNEAFWHNKDLITVQYVVQGNVGIRSEKGESLVKGIWKQSSLN